MSECAICGETSVVHVGSPGGFESVRCRRCGSVTVIQSSTPHAKLYGHAYYESSYIVYERERSEFFDRLLSRLGAGRGRLLIDVGCGAGLALDAARRAGWTTIGVEESLAGCQLSASRGHAVVRALAESPSIRASAADVVLLLDVLAHIDDPSRGVHEAAKLLAPGGRLLVKTPSRPAWKYHMVRLAPKRIARSLLHLPHQRHSITARGLVLMMMAAGLKEVTVAPSDEAISLRSQMRGDLKRSIPALLRAGFERTGGSPSLVAQGHISPG